MAAVHPPIATKAQSPVTKNRPVLRFDRVQRAAHWANALLFFILILTGAELYFGIYVHGFGRAAVEETHLYAGLTLPAPIVLSLLGPWGKRMRRDLRRINYWTRDEIRWLRTLGGRNSPPVTDKFNPGQKLNAIFIGAVIVVMLATGAILKWFQPFPISWRQGATFVHDVLFFVIMAVVIGHIGFALTHLDSLRSMIRGWVDERWASKHAPGWLKEMQAAASRRKKSQANTQ